VLELRERCRFYDPKWRAVYFALFLTGVCSALATHISTISLKFECPLHQFQDAAPAVDGRTARREHKELHDAPLVAHTGFLLNPERKQPRSNAVFRSYDARK
jgi:hypothetical protein